MTEAIRLAKRVAAMVPCSRSEAEQYIEGGWVRVDGEVVEAPQHRVSDAQRVEIDTAATLEKSQSVSFLLHKPAGMGDADALRLLVPANRVPGASSAG